MRSERVAIELRGHLVVLCVGRARINRDTSLAARLQKRGARLWRQRALPRQSCVEIAANAGANDRIRQPPPVDQMERQ